MSYSKIGHILPIKIDDDLVAKQLAEALRQTHLDVASTMKNISHITGINSETIAKWHKRQNPPKAAHLLILAANYPAVLKALFEIMGWPELWDAAIRENIPQRMQTRLKEKSIFYSTRGDKSVTSQISQNTYLPPRLNARQVWFLEELRKGCQLQNRHIAMMWRVNERTAKRDTGTLVAAGLIHFRKLGRGGWYEIIIRT